MNKDNAMKYWPCTKHILNRPFGLTVVLTIFVSSMLNAQTPSNGTRATSEYISFLIANLPNEQAIRVDTLNPKLNVELSLQVHEVILQDGSSNFDRNDLEIALAWVNQYFPQMGIRYTIADINTIPEYEYGIILVKDSTREMRNRYARKDYINLFLVDQINIDGIPYYGYTTFPDDSLETSIYLMKDYVAGKYLATLLGNFLGLLHTHESLGGIENVSGNNCGQAGDFICETYADPNILDQIDEECHYVGMITDPQGDYYAPTVSNLMSESLDVCKCLFTYEQYRRMKYYYMHYRAGLH